MWLKVQHPRQGVVFLSSVLFKVARTKVILFFNFQASLLVLFHHPGLSQLSPSRWSSSRLTSESSVLSQ